MLLSKHNLFNSLLTYSAAAAAACCCPVFFIPFFFLFPLFPFSFPSLCRQKWLIGSRGAKAFLKYFQARKKLHQSTPYRYTYHLGLASIVSVDDNDVGRIVSQKAKWHMMAGRPDVPLHLIAHDGREVFCYATKLQVYPGNINSCRIGLMVVCPQGEKDDDDDEDDEEK